MLRVTVELWPDGRESGRRVIATADIGRVADGVHADYEARLTESPIGSVGTGHVRAYPRWSASIWDLVARSIAAALGGNADEMPPRPALPDVPVHISDGLRYVRLREIPEPARTFFRRRIEGSTRPVIADDPEPMDCAYVWDWEGFLGGGESLLESRLKSVGHAVKVNFDDL
ncbi:hypothetical protein [Burkholderia sp. MSMB1589WGS]|uniref:hypothetical protein n=1 Tax=Burkholderia sp. MSMB1589WGS TaxID=1636425 RepID=UPI000A7CD0BF|nr:hypothetical protein [Burkholderia sp. MSMB1589WGS]